MNCEIILIKHNGCEPSSFKLSRPFGTDDYLFLHFKTPTVFTLIDKTHCISPETCIILSPGTPHTFYPDGCELIHDWVHFMPSDLSEFLSLEIPLDSFLSPVDTGFITSAVKRCELELIHKEALYKELISAEMTAMLIKLKRQLSSNATGHHADALKSLRLGIYRNPELYGDTSDMADSVNLSRSRFAVVYKELFGISPKKDLIKARVSKAEYLLSVGTLSLTEISEICGYQSIYHFIRQFRAVTGSTPGAYRKIR